MYPPQPALSCTTRPRIGRYFSQPLFLWMPRRLWQVKLHCPQEDCTRPELTSVGIYNKVRQVLDVNGCYTIAGETLICPSCKKRMVSWNQKIIEQLDMGHQLQFPCILTYRLACDLKVIRLLRQRGIGNSASQIRCKIQEQHSEVWLQKCIQYMTDCQGFSSAAASGLILPSGYEEPPPLAPVPQYRWLMQVYAQDVMQRIEEVKSNITSLLGNILKMDSTKKVVKKLAGESSKTAMWATNVGNEFGQVIISVLTTGEGHGLSPMIHGLIRRYRDAEVPPPQLLYVDRDCCGNNQLRRMFAPWTELSIHLDIWHFMRRLSVGCTTDAHALYATFMSSLSQCIYMWDPEDVDALIAAKRSELEAMHIENLTDAEVFLHIKSSELTTHCRRTTRGVEETTRLITQLINSLDGDNGRDTQGVPLINSERMTEIWKQQQKHVQCIQDPPNIQLYTQTGVVKKGGHHLPVYRCARGSTSLECFHLHLSRFIPGTKLHIFFAHYLKETLQVSCLNLFLSNLLFYRYSCKCDSVPSISVGWTEQMESRQRYSSYHHSSVRTTDVQWSSSPHGQLPWRSCVWEKDGSILFCPPQIHR